jgi:hypothetical protein
MEQTAARHWLAEHDPLGIVLLADPVVELVGHDARSSYTENFWTPVLGPASVILLRRLADYLDDSPSGFVLPLGEAAATLGLGHTSGCNGRLIRTMERLITFGMARPLGDDLAVRQTLPPLARRHIARLPGPLVERLRQEQPHLAKVRTGPAPDSLPLVGRRRLGKSTADPPGGGSGPCPGPARSAAVNNQPA